MIEILISVGILLTITLLHLYLWKRLVVQISPVRSAWRLLGSILTVCSWAIITLTLVSGPYGAPIAALDSVDQAGILWLGAFLIGAGIVFVADVKRHLTKPSKAVRGKILIIFALA